MRRTPDHRQKTTAGAPPAASYASKNPFAPRLLAVLAGAVLVTSLAGCGFAIPLDDRAAPAGPTTAGPSADVPATDAAAPGTQPAGPLATTAAAPVSGGSVSHGDAPGAGASAAEAAATEAARQKVTETLGRLAAGTPKPATAQVHEALTGAGIAPGVLEVSQSRTPTGLEADAIEAAVLQGKDCVIGQVRDGAVAVTVLPVLASGKCFVGS